MHYQIEKETIHKFTFRLSHNGLSCNVGYLTRLSQSVVIDHVENNFIRQNFLTTDSELLTFRKMKVINYKGFLRLTTSQMNKTCDKISVVLEVS